MIAGQPGAPFELCACLCAIWHMNDGRCLEKAQERVRLPNRPRELSVCRPCGNAMRVFLRAEIQEEDLTGWCVRCFERGAWTPSLPEGDLCEGHADLPDLAEEQEEPEEGTEPLDRQGSSRSQTVALAALVLVVIAILGWAWLGRPLGAS